MKKKSGSAKPANKQGSAILSALVNSSPARQTENGAIGGLPEEQSRGFIGENEKVLAYKKIHELSKSDIKVLYDNLDKNVKKFNTEEYTVMCSGSLLTSDSCFPWFNRIVEINKNNGWLNPVFQPNKNQKFKDEFFTIKVDDYLEIESNYEVDIFRVSKRWGEIIIYCRVVFD